MKDKIAMRQVAYVATLVAMAASLAGCDSLSQAAGLTKSAPDEFAIVTKAPLIIPPDYNLQPPRPGEAPVNQVGPTAAAQSAMFGSTSSAASAGVQFSSAEQELLAKAGASNANDMIRQKIAADRRAMQAEDDSFTNQILFGFGSDHSGGTPVNADAEIKRIDAAKAAHGNGGAAPAKPADESSAPKKDSGSWFDDIF